MCLIQNKKIEKKNLTWMLTQTHTHTHTHTHTNQTIRQRNGD